MTLTQSLLTFTVAAALLAATPGVDTALVLRALVALGLGALLKASAVAFNMLKAVGAAYLLWQGVKLLLRRSDGEQTEAIQPATPAQGAAFWTGFLTNVLNPKVGVFYVTLLPQFVVTGVPAGPYIFALAGIHVGLSLLWFVLLITAARPLQRWLARPRVQTTLDRITGGVFVLFGLRLVVAQPQ